jgi:hypothetical protein
MADSMDLMMGNSMVCEKVEKTAASLEVLKAVLWVVWTVA